MGMIKKNIEALKNNTNWPSYTSTLFYNRLISEKLKCPASFAPIKNSLDKSTCKQLLCQLARSEGIRLFMGLKNVTNLLLHSSPSLIILAAHKDHLETSFWIPYLCKRKGVPIVNLNSKERIGRAF